MSPRPSIDIGIGCTPSFFGKRIFTGALRPCARVNESEEANAVRKRKSKKMRQCCGCYCCSDAAAAQTLLLLLLLTFATLTITSVPNTQKTS